MVIGRPYIPERGEIVWLDFDPQAGHEQAGRRPALVLSPREYNSRAGLAIVCPITSQVKGYKLEASLPQGLPVQGVVLSDHIKSMDWRVRRAELICRAPRAVLLAVIGRVTSLLRE
ncbi:MAG TPA: type II toxin-antitoxin system PemK/MazF family toxin [Anaerolineae bacterium]|nr:type II toxin-antitoxin system PemK/MazF family toxin [Anaerolineae bacterium]